MSRVKRRAGIQQRRIVAKKTHTKTVDALATLGSILTDDEIDMRDAVHIAVLPVIANNDLSPGEHVGIVDHDDIGNCAVDTSCDKHIGIIDPFLPRVVKAGELCYMMLYPRTITGLQHHWTHPDVPDVVDVQETRNHQNTVMEAEAALRRYCDDGGWSTPSYETLYENAVNSVRYRGDEEYLIINGEDASGEIPAHVISDLKIVMEARGIDVSPSWGPTYFSCSC